MSSALNFKIRKNNYFVVMFLKTLYACHSINNNNKLDGNKLNVEWKFVNNINEKITIKKRLYSG